MNWKQLQGQIVDGDFQLLENLGGNEDSATFLAAAPGDAKAAVKLVNSSQHARELLSRWKIAEGLSHPHLLRVFRSGSCELSGTEFLFMAMEYAEENLSQVLPQRALAPEEVREMLPPVLDALEYLHREGVVHGNLTPGNIMAADDQLKLSSDGLMRAGDPLRHVGPYTAPETASGVIPASDLWSLGVTLAEVLTQRRPTWESGSTLAQLPDNMPEQFRVMVQRCLIPDPGLRGTIADIRERLKPAATVATAVVPANERKKKSKPSTLKIAIPAGVAVVALGAFLAMSHQTDAPTQPESQSAPTATTADAVPHVQSPPPSVLTEATDPKPAPEPEKPQADKPQKLEVLMPANTSGTSPAPAPAKPQTAGERPTKTATGSDGIVHQVLPDVPSKAMRTINGKVRVAIRVRVNREGNVIGSQFVSRGPSRYFADRTMQAAKEWKFRPAASEQAWNLEFEFRRSGITANPTQLDR